MSNSYCFTFSAIELSVRYCDNPNHDPDVINCYVHLGLQRAKGFKQLKNVRHAHMRVVDTLIDTMCDSTLPLHWREHCYLYIKRLLPLLFEMLSAEQYAKKTAEITVLYQFFIQNRHSSPSKQADAQQADTPKTLSKKYFNQ